MTRFIDEDRKKHIELISSFCQSDSQNGGILLLSGARGVGKTRLVDEALVNDQNSLIKKFFNYLGTGSRSRKKIERGPRRSKRSLIRVNVDPFFPFSQKNHTDTTSDDNKSESLNINEKNEVTMMLLRNIIFALTSNIDPRLNWCAHGRVLSQRLGCSFWFSPTTATGLTKVLSWCFLGVLPVFFLFYLINVNIPSIIFYCSLPFLFFLSLFLRCLDWKALTHIGHDLYDLAHAQEVKKTDDKLAKNLDAAIHPMSSYSIKGVVSLLLGFFISFIVFQTEYFNSLNSLIDEYLGFSIESYKPFIQWLPALSGLAIFGVTVSISASSRRHIARYGNKNPAWLVTLLRRYLFIAHRCGIEPVLVFDELDKLEVSFDRFFNQGENSKENDDEQLSSLLLHFLDALLRVRDSSGAGFLMILISSPQLHYQLRQVRQRSLFHSVSMAPTGTLIQQELCLGSMSIDSAIKYFKAQPDYSSKLFDIQYALYFWILSHGLFANYIRLIEQYFSGSFEKLSPQQLERSSKLSDYLQTFWNLEDAWRVGEMNFNEDREDILNFRMKDEFWYRCFIHTGMLQYCHALLEGIDGDEKITANNAKKEIEKLLRSRGKLFANIHYKMALVVGNPILLRLLGHQLMYLMLTKVRAFDSLPNEEVRLKFKLSEPYLRVESVKNKERMRFIVQDFQVEFEFKKTEFVILIVEIQDEPNDWTVAGYNDAGEFKKIFGSDFSNEMFEESKSTPVNDSEVVQLIASKLGRTIPDNKEQ